MTAVCLVIAAVAVCLVIACLMVVMLVSLGIDPLPPVVVWSRCLLEAVVDR